MLVKIWNALTWLYYVNKKIIIFKFITRIFKDNLLINWLSLNIIPIKCLNSMLPINQIILLIIIPICNYLAVIMVMIQTSDKNKMWVIKINNQLFSKNSLGKLHKMLIQVKMRKIIKIKSKRLYMMINYGCKTIHCLIYKMQ